MPLGYLGFVLRGIELDVGTDSIDWGLNGSDGMRPDGSASGSSV